ncbi:hypothetical protein HanXRQr2_Chr07g0306741 [Helianthus annuus]|uniref:Uncharacterized protein n=1 Tax=Helianthus annuus TaxID=4232 RepID=A0A9K3INA8_HELAN|nr:hypothetical protein HanXRQr2_Chr07g0306741 [Helianthus annuus]KAJ0905693.1 hypothetical protein HanPSC8_Chr07g0296881 [Helianthus annuus]
MVVISGAMVGLGGGEDGNTVMVVVAHRKREFREKESNRDS